MLDLRKLEVFIKVYETQSFSKASAVLHLAQPTITLHIKDLEEELEVSLFDRNTRKVVPSKAGKIVYRYGKEVLNIIKQMEKELKLLKDEKVGMIEIGGSTIPGQYILPKIIKSFKEKYPNISVFLKVGDSKEVVEKVLAKEIDFGMIGAVFVNKDLVFLPCYEDEIVLIAPTDFAKEEISLEELYKIPILKREEGSGTWKNFLEALDKKNIDWTKLNIIGEMGSTEAIKEAVKAGLGFGLVSSLAVGLETSLNLLKVVRIKNLVIKRKFYMVYLRMTKLLPIEHKFLEFIKEFSNL
ncbi:LysR family transcriptional regulator [Thermodesulfobacterium sp. TA1]|uniref:selenium metabolism-associated LysR family transcriptional regulator n=1 Tax=Thermodesulfobacterium sp. TA1 TaxID=2234087 RepID=UPI0012327DC7|nr:selenium metabolism-associated LysR family transcriptional regulator [Thermodesulfobacterium sp. TA1]QER42242.1 LysR family transcriptional regulator [Thermodesulfobacterium sp. TA1]